MKPLEIEKMSNQNKKESDHKYYIKNKDKIIKGSTEWNKKHRAYHREYDRKWRAKYPEKHRNAYLKRTYSLSISEYEAIKIAQNGLCGICGVKADRLVVDRCHKTKRIRGLLCTCCNAGIGQLKEDISLLAKAISYLKKYETS